MSSLFQLHFIHSVSKHYIMMKHYIKTVNGCLVSISQVHNVPVLSSTQTTGSYFANIIDSVVQIFTLS